MIRLLLVTAEQWPTTRVDVADLFGKYLPALDVYSDLVAVRDSSVPWSEWPGGRAIVGSPPHESLLRHWSTATHAIAALWRASPNEYQAVQLRDLPVLGMFLLLLARLKGIPCIYWMSYPLPDGLVALAHARRRAGVRWRWLPTWLRGKAGSWVLYRWLLPRMQHVFVQSDRMQQDLLDRGVQCIGVTAVPMGVNLTAMDHAVAMKSSETGQFPGKRVLAYLGTLDRSRCFELLLDALVQIRHRVPDALLIVVGDTSDLSHRHWLLSRASELGLDEVVVWTGWLPIDAARALVARAEVGFSMFPRGHILDSASPTKVAEYLALGVPVVCNDNPEQARLIMESGAGSCVPLTATDFAEAALSWLQMDQAARLARGRAGRAYIETHRSYDVIANRVAKIYRGLLGSGSDVVDQWT